MASNTPKATRTSSSTSTPTRGRGRGRPRLYPRGTSSALARRRTVSTPKATEATPTARRKVQISAGYRPGGAGGGGRYVHPITGEEIPAAIWKELLKRGDSSLEGLVVASSSRTPKPTSSATTGTATPRGTVPPPPLPAPPLPVGPDGVYKPREERSYTEFHPSFDPDQPLPVYPAPEVDGENYKPPSLEQLKSVTIADVKEEEQRKEDFHASLPENTNLDDAQSMDGIYQSHGTGFPASPSLNGSSSLGHYEGHGPMNPHHQPMMGKSNFGSPMEGIQPTHNFGDIAVDPALTGLTPPPPPSIDPSLILPIDPALGDQHSLPQVQTPDATPTDGVPKDDAIFRSTSPHPMTPGPPGTAKRGKEVATLASTRPHRSNAGKPPPRSQPPATARRSRASNQVSWGDEKLQLRAPSYRPIEPYKYSEVAWNSQIGSTGAYGLNTIKSTRESFSTAMIKVGYQESSRFNRPVTLFRDYPDNAVDEELGCGEYDVVEYDMDEQDDKWLTNYNSHRYLSQGSPITREVFEIAITKIEKEWVNLERRIPKVSAKPHGQGHARRRSSGRVGDDEDDDGAEDSKCVICDDGECENANAIVFCDGCNLAVHQECYGVPYIPEGQWHCRKCQQIPRQVANCVFCPNTDGAFKQTTTNRWAHLLCAIWIPEVRLANPSFMEPVEGMELVPKSRWKLTCYICKQKMGACIQCSNKNCFIAFHVTCGRRARLHMKMKNSSGPGAQLESSGLKALCDKHVPADWRRENDVDNAVQDAMDFYAQEHYGRDWGDSQAAAITGPGMLSDEEHPPNGVMQRVSFKAGDKRKRHAEPKAIWKLPSGAPVVPHVLFDKIVDYMTGFEIKGVREFTAEVCKYWTLKREARRGACLIRRLQIQADSNSFTSLEIVRKDYAALGHTQGEKALGHRKDFAMSLENDLSRILNAVVVNLPDHELYVSEADRLRHYVDAVYFPEIRLMRNVLDRAKSFDSHATFEFGLSLIGVRLEYRLYPSVSAFSMDLRSVLQSPPAEPRLAFTINVPDFNSLPRPRTSSSERTSDLETDGDSLLVQLEPYMKQATALENELHLRLRDVPAPKLRKLDNAGITNGVSPMETDAHSPSMQLVQEAEPVVKTETRQPTVLEPLVPAVTNIMEKGRWDKRHPQWFINNYQLGDSTTGPAQFGGAPSPVTPCPETGSTVGEITDSDYHRVVESRMLNFGTPGAEPRTISPEVSSRPSAETEQAPESVHNNDLDYDEDMEDAPGDIDEEFLPALPSPAPVKFAQEDPVHIYSDLHDEDAEGEIDDEVPAPEASTHFQIAASVFQDSERPTRLGEPKQDAADIPVEYPKESTPPPPPSEIEPVTPHKSPTPTATPAKAPTSVNAVSTPPRPRSPVKTALQPTAQATSPAKKSVSPKKSISPAKLSTPTKSAFPTKIQAQEARVNSPMKAASPVKPAMLENPPVRKKSSTPIRSTAQLAIGKSPASTTEPLPREAPSQIRPLRIALPSRVQQVAPPARVPEFIPTKYTEIRPVFHEDIRNDDDLLGGYRPEDLPSPVGEASPPPATPPMSNGAIAAIVNVAMASNPPAPAQTDLPEHPLPQLLPEQSDNMDLEMMTNTSVLSDYPDQIDDPEYEAMLRAHNQHNNEDADNDVDGTSPQGSARKSRKGAEFKRDSNGRFGKNKTPTPTTAPAATTPSSRTRRRLRGQ